MAFLGKCKLCGCSKKILLSHIIPNSYYKKSKKSSGQLIRMSNDNKQSPQLCNSSPTERLFCAECEKFLNERYEAYGVTVLRNKHNIIKNKSYITIKNLNYKKFYLYLITILWRASISKTNDFKVELGQDLEEMLKHFILKEDTKMTTSIRLENFIKISLLRIVDDTGNFKDEAIKSLIVNFGFDVSEEDNKSIFYFMIEGFLIIYMLSAENDIHKLRFNKNISQITNNTFIKIKRIQYHELKEINDVFNSIYLSKEKISSSIKK